MFFPAQRKFLLPQNITKGFTLIELLVVISIIAILFGVATVSYTNVQKKSRDGKRKADLAAIQQALAVFYADNSAYPDESSANKITCTLDGSNGDPGNIVDWGSAFSCPVSIPTKSYMTQLPKDPIDNVYIYEVFNSAVSGDWCNASTNGKCQKYTLWARLENNNDQDIAASESDGICDVSKTNTTTSWSTEVNARNYCVHSPK